MLKHELGNYYKSTICVGKQVVPMDVDVDASGIFDYAEICSDTPCADITPDTTNIPANLTRST